MLKRKMMFLSTILLAVSLCSCNLTPDSSNQPNTGNASSSTSATNNNHSSDSSSAKISISSSSQPEDTYFNVTFLDYDSSFLYKGQVKKGEDAVYKGAIPAREDSETCSYSFTGWNKSLKNIQEDTYFIARYSETYNNLTVTFVNYDNTVLATASVKYGGTAVYPIKFLPTRASTDQYRYTFSGWDKPLTNITANTTFTAQYTSSFNQVTATFVNYDGTKLFTASVNYGSTVIYSGIAPTREKTAQYTFTFKGWDKPLTNITSNTTFTAQYISTVNQYTVTFLNYDGIKLDTCTVDYNGTATYSGETPTRPDSNSLSYTFKGWNKTLTNIQSSFSTTATYNQTELVTSEGLSYIYSTNTNSYRVSGFDNSHPYLEIPSTYNDGTNGEHPVTLIGTGVFKNTTIKSIKIPDSITSLENECFSNCTSLTSVTIPSSVTSLGNSCFYYCTSLKSIIIPNSVTSLGNLCFYYCTSLTSVTIPSSVTSLGNWCFYYCTSLTSVTIPSSITSLEAYCFGSCLSLTSVIIPNRVTSLGQDCFSNCTSLTSVTIPSSVTSLGYQCFSNCSSLTSVTIPSSVTSLGQECFSGCSKLASIYSEATSKPSNWNSTWKDGCESDVYWYSESSNTDGSHWHYVLVDGVNTPTVWKK